MNGPNRGKICSSTIFLLACLGCLAPGAVEPRTNGHPSPAQLRGASLPSEARARTSTVQPLASAPSGVVWESARVFKFIYFLPDNYKTRGQWPLILFLHGACSNEDVTKLRHFGPIKHALKVTNFPFVIVAPASARGWPDSELDLFLRGLTPMFPRVDWRRVYLTGYSMGGHATWSMAERHPGRFAAIAPVAGAGNPTAAQAVLRQTPAWIFHGAADAVVPVAYGQAMAEAMSAAGAAVKTTFYPGRGHEIWDLPYRGPELYDWFLEHGPKSR